LLVISKASSSVLHSDSHTLPYALTKELLYTLYLDTGMYYTLTHYAPSKFGVSFYLCVNKII